MLDKLVKEEQRRAKEAWSKVLSGKKILSDKEAEAMLRILKASRKEHEFRAYSK